MTCRMPSASCERHLTGGIDYWPGPLTVGNWPVVHDCGAWVFLAVRLCADAANGDTMSFPVSSSACLQDAAAARALYEVAPPLQLQQSTFQVGTDTCGWRA